MNGGAARVAPEELDFRSSLPRHFSSGSPAEAMMAEKKLPEWMPWLDMRLLLIAFGICDAKEEPELIGEWAEQGNLPTRARLYFSDGSLTKDKIIPLSVWQAARAQGGVNWDEGNIEAQHEPLVGTRPIKVRARDIQVNTDCLRELLQLDESDAAAARARLGSCASNAEADARSARLSFQPQSLDRISPTLEIEEAVHWLCGYSRVADAQILVTADGQIKSRIEPNGVVLEGEDAARVGGDRLAQFASASYTTLQALQGAVLRAYVWSPRQGVPFLVPRFYWNGQDAFAMFSPIENPATIGGGDTSMTGKPMLSRAEFDAWRASAQPLPNADMLRLPLVTPAEAHNKTARSQRGRRRGTGGYRLDDELIARRMRKRVDAGDNRSPWQIASDFRDEIKGSAHEDNHIKRVVAVYYALFPAA